MSFTLLRTIDMNKNMIFVFNMKNTVIITSSYNLNENSKL